MGDFSLGTITPLVVTEWEGFDFPEVARVQSLLGTSPSTTLNAVVQGGSLGYAEGRIRGTLVSSTHLSSLRTFYQAKSSQTFTDDGGATYTVRVFDLDIKRLQTPSGSDAWEYSCRLVKVA